MKTVLIKLSARLLACAFLALPVQEAHAEDSALCQDLSKFACAPGEYDDGTGVVKSDEAVEQTATRYAAKHSAAIRGKVEKLITGPENEHFFNISKGALGLDSAPQCTSKVAADLAKCRDNVAEGLASLARKLTLGSYVPQPGLERTPNLEAMGYIISTDGFDRMIKEIGTEFEKDFGSEEKRRKIETQIFPEVKALLVKRLREAPISESARSIMIAKINGIKFGGTSCAEGAPGTSTLATVLMPNAFYSPERNTFNFCAGFFAVSSSEFHSVSTIAHELAHAIDPCFITQGPTGAAVFYKNRTDWVKAEAEFPIPNVIQCLRGPRSIQALATARVVGESGGKAPATSDSSSKPTARAAGTSRRANNVNFCENDQITESFSDWLSAEVLPDYMERNHKLTPAQYVNGYANTFRIACDGVEKATVDENGKLDVHPTTAGRLNKIILANPKIRRQMGCTEKNPDVDYCEAKVVVANEPVTVAPERATEVVPKRNSSGSAQ